MNKYASAVKRAAAALALGLCASTMAPAETFTHGRFADVVVYGEPATAQAVVLFLSGADGWTEDMAALARSLAAAGALVIGVSLPPFIAALEHDGASCVYPDGDLDNLSRFVQAYYELRSYRAPLLVGYGAGASFAYAMLAQASPDTFAGALSVDFCPEIALAKPLCAGANLHASADAGKARLTPAPDLRAPWIVVQDAASACSASARTFVTQSPGAEWVALPTAVAVPGATYGETALIQAYGKLAAMPQPQSPAPPVALSDLPVVEVPAQGSTDYYAVFLSGDGGWAGLDREVAGALAAHGVAVVGLDSLRYFWKARTPQSTADDVASIMRYYGTHWRKPHVLLIGYSQGANVLPFVVNRLPTAMRSQVALVAMIGLAPRTTFEFHLSNWVSRSAKAGVPVLSEIERLAGVRALCLYGVDDDDALCPQLGGTDVRSVQMPGGHHFGGDYERLARTILEAARLRAP